MVNSGFVTLFRNFTTLETRSIPFFYQAETLPGFARFRAAWMGGFRLDDLFGLLVIRGNVFDFELGLRDYLKRSPWSSWCGSVTQSAENHGVFSELNHFCRVRVVPKGDIPPL